MGVAITSEKQVEEMAYKFLINTDKEFINKMRNTSTVLTKFKEDIIKQQKASIKKDIIENDLFNIMAERLKVKGITQEKIKEVLDLFI